MMSFSLRPTVSSTRVCAAWTRSSSFLRARSQSSALASPSLSIELGRQLHRRRRCRTGESARKCARDDQRHRSGWVDQVHRIVVRVRVQVEPAREPRRVLRDEPAGCRVVVARTELVEAGVAVVDAAGEAEREERGVAARDAERGVLDLGGDASVPDVDRGADRAALVDGEVVAELDDESSLAPAPDGRYASQHERSRSAASPAAGCTPRGSLRSFPRCFLGKLRARARDAG